MTRGRQGGGPSNMLDMMLGAISQTSTDILIKKNEILSNPDKQIVEIDVP